MFTLLASLASCWFSSLIWMLVEALAIAWTPAQTFHTLSNKSLKKQPNHGYTQLLSMDLVYHGQTNLEFKDWNCSPSPWVLFWSSLLLNFLSWRRFSFAALLKDQQTLISDSEWRSVNQWSVRTGPKRTSCLEICIFWIASIWYPRVLDIPFFHRRRVFKLPKAVWCAGSETLCGAFYRALLCRASLVSAQPPVWQNWSSKKDHESP